MRPNYLFLATIICFILVNNLYAKKSKKSKKESDNSDEVLKAAENSDQVLKAALPPSADVSTIEPSNNNKSEITTESAELIKTTKQSDTTTTDLPKTLKKKKKKKKKSTDENLVTTTESSNSSNSENDLTLVCHFEPSNKKESEQWPPKSIVFVPQSTKKPKSKKSKKKKTTTTTTTEATVNTTVLANTIDPSLRQISTEPSLAATTGLEFLKHAQNETSLSTEHYDSTESNNSTTDANNNSNNNDTNSSLRAPYIITAVRSLFIHKHSNDTADNNSTDTNSTDQDKKLKDSYYHYEYEYESESYSKSGKKGKSKNSGLGGLGSGSGSGLRDLGGGSLISKPKKSKPKKKKKSGKSSSSASSYEESYEEEEIVTKSKKKPKKTAPKPKSYEDEEIVEDEDSATKPKKSKSSSKSSETAYYSSKSSSLKSSGSKSASSSSSSSSSGKSSAESPEYEEIVEEKPVKKQTKKPSKTTELVEYEDDTTTQKAKAAKSAKSAAEEGEEEVYGSTEWTYGSTEWVVTSKPKKGKREAKYETDYDYEVNSLNGNVPLNQFAIRDKEYANKNHIRVESDLSNQCKELIRDKRSAFKDGFKSMPFYSGINKFKEIMSNASEEFTKKDTKKPKTYDMVKYGEVNKLVMAAYKETFDQIREKYQSDPTFANSYNETAMNRKPLWIDMYNNNPVLRYIPGRTCFRELGCFIAENFYENTPRAFSLLPETPNALAVRFLLFTPKNPRTGYELAFNSPDADIKKSPFNEQFRTVFIVHGFWDGYDGLSDVWQSKIRNNFLDNGNTSNVIIIDWSKGSKVVLYPLALTNARIVGSEIAFFIKRIVETYKQIYYYDKVHCIGHNLGAHSCGWLGKRVERKIGRITGLDPSGPLFYQTQDRLTIDDARLVDIIHTDWGDNHKEGYGIKDSIGHFDFYPNGGHNQPQCRPTTGVKPIVRDIVTGIFQSCSHLRAIEMFHIFNDRHAKCQPIGYECDDYYYFIEGRCANCGPSNDKCKLMGHWPEYWASTTTTTTRKFYLKTTDRNCLFHYQIALHIDANSQSESNNIDLKIIVNGDQKKTTITKTAHFLEPESIYVFLYVSESRLGLASDVTFEWTSGGKANNNDTLSVNCIELNHMSHSNKKIRDKNTSVVCPKNNQIHSGEAAVFEKCVTEPGKLARYASPFDLKPM